MSKKKADELTNTSNDAKDQIEIGIPYTVRVTIRGVADYLYHRWSNASVAEKAAAKKGSATKKSDDVESYVYRNEDGFLCIAGEQLRMAMVNAAKFKQDPRSPRKSAADLFKAAVVVLTPLASTGQKEWDYLDMRRVVIQRNGITRSRPALRPGWEVEFMIMVNLPEYINQEMLNDTISSAGRLIGIGDFRPTYGRFQVIEFDLFTE